MLFYVVVYFKGIRREMRLNTGVNKSDTKKLVDNCLMACKCEWGRRVFAASNSVVILVYFAGGEDGRFWLFLLL